MPSPSNSLSYIYHDADAYIESSTNSSSTSPMNSPQYDLSYHGVYPSPEHADGSGDLNQLDESQQSTAKAPAKRKRENRYKNAPPSVLSRRRAQNRASQRAYRERKDQRIKDLEVLLGEAQSKNDVLSQAYSALQTEYIKLKSEQDSALQYQQAGLTFDPSLGQTVASDIDLFLYNDNSGYNI